jgi:hypothetical protein
MSYKLRTTVIVLPVMVGVPLMGFYVPPLVLLTPAVVASGLQLGAGVSGLPAIPAVVSDGVVQSVVGALGAMLTFGFVGVAARCSGKNQEASECEAGNKEFRVLNDGQTTLFLHFTLLRMR